MTHNRSILARISPLADFALAICCAYIAPDLTNLISPLFGWEIKEEFNIIVTTPFVVGMAITAVPLVLRLLGFYHRGNLQRITTAVRQLATFLVYYLCAAALYQSTRSQGDYLYIGHVILTGAVLLPVLVFARFLLFRSVQIKTDSDGRRLRRVLLVGTSADVEQGWANLPDSWKRSLSVAGTAIEAETSESAIQSIIEEKHVDQMFLFGGLGAYNANSAAVNLCELQGIDVYIVLKDEHAVTLRAFVTEIDNNRALLLSSTPVISLPQFIKAAMDRTLALLAIILSSPLWLVAVIGIRCSDPNGPIFYRQMRSGLYGKPFRMWKFRSMYADADKRLDEIKAKYGNEMEGPIFKLTNDPRIFRFGHFLRKTSIDELPQLLNILCGDMSIVGPRPLPTYETAQFPDIRDRRRLSVKPGLTCYWQVEDRSDSPEFSTMVKKDLLYIDNWSLWLDLVLILRTIPAVLFGRGAK